MPDIYPPYNYCPSIGYELGEYKGKLALVGGWWIDSDMPRYYRDIRVSNIPIEEYNLQGVLGTRTSKWNGNIGYLDKPVFGAHYIDVSQWKNERVYMPIPKPRANRKFGKRYHWVWRPNWISIEGRWVKEYER